MRTNIVLHADFIKALRVIAKRFAKQEQRIVKLEKAVALSRKASKVAVIVVITCLTLSGCAAVKPMKINVCNWGGQTCVHQTQVPVPHGRGRR